MNSIKKLLLFILPLALAFVSCEKEANETPVIRAVALDIPKEAGTYTLNYTISGASSSAVAEASVDVDWIYDIAVEPGTVSFSADLIVEVDDVRHVLLVSFAVYEFLSVILGEVLKLFVLRGEDDAVGVCRCQLSERLGFAEVDALFCNLFQIDIAECDGPGKVFSGSNLRHFVVSREDDFGILESRFVLIGLFKEKRDDA